MLHAIMGLENIKFADEANAADEIVQTEEKLLAEIKEKVVDISLDSINTMTAEQLGTFIEKEFQNTNGQRLTYSSMQAKEPFYAFSLEAAMDLISDKLGDKKYTAEGIEDVSTDGSGGGKTLDERLIEYGNIDATDDSKNTSIVKLLQNILGVTADGYAGPETMANITALLKGTTLESIQVEGYDADNPYGYSKISTLLPTSNDEVTEKDAKQNIIQEKITAYTADGVTEEMKTKLVTELEADLIKNITNYTGAGFHKNLAIAILTQQTSFSWNNITFYPIIAADGTITITDKSDEAETKRNEVESAKKETERLAKATAYSEKLFPTTLSIAQTGDVYYIIIPEVKPPLLPLDTPVAITKIPFSSKENAQSFIDISKKYIQISGYKLDKDASWSDSARYLAAKKTYLDRIKKLIATDKSSISFSGIVETSKILTSLSVAIDALDCWTKESVA